MSCGSLLSSRQDPLWSMELVKLCTTMLNKGPGSSVNLPVCRIFLICNELSREVIRRGAMVMEKQLFGMQIVLDLTPCISLESTDNHSTQYLP